MVVHLGRGTWWDGLAPEPQVVHTILGAVSQGKFKETLRLCCGRVMTSHGQLQLPHETWNDRKWGLPLGRRVTAEYQPFAQSLSRTHYENRW
jgi:hypothetical protein